MPDSAGLIYSPISVVCSSANLNLKDAKQSNCTLHAVLNNKVYKDDSSRRCSGEATRQELVKHEILPPPQCTNKMGLQRESVYSAKFSPFLTSCLCLVDAYLLLSR